MPTEAAGLCVQCNPKGDWTKDGKTTSRHVLTVTEVSTRTKIRKMKENLYMHVLHWLRCIITDGKCSLKNIKDQEMTSSLYRR